MSSVQLDLNAYPAGLAPPSGYEAWRNRPSTLSEPPRVYPSPPQAPVPRNVTLPSLTSLPQKVFDVLSPLQASGLFVAGLATAYGLRWFIYGLTHGLAQPQLFNQTSMNLKPLQTIGATIERQTAVYFQRGLEGVVMMALKYPELQNRLKAYLGAGILGYAAGSFAKGTQEVWIRREETQIRADLVSSLKQTFQQSLQKKIAYDQALREYAKSQILGILNRNGVSQPEGLLSPLPHHPEVNNNWRYPFEPVHFTKSVPGMSARSGQTDFDPALQETPQEAEAQNRRSGMKAIVYGLGVGTGLLYHGFNSMLKQNTVKAATKSPAVKHTLLEITNAMDREAMFLMGSNRVLLSVLGLTAAGRLGKLLLDGYREIEVTRQHAETERRYQRYNWLGLDPNFHAISEQEGLKAQLARFEQSLRAYPQIQLNRPLLQQSIQDLLQNIGRESAPRYFPMTPSVNLVAARS